MKWTSSMKVSHVSPHLIRYLSMSWWLSDLSLSTVTTKFVNCQIWIERLRFYCCSIFLLKFHGFYEIIITILRAYESSVRRLEVMAVIEDCWNYRVDINTVKNRNYPEFESRVWSLRDDILNKNCFKIRKFSYNNVQSHEDELKCLSEENKQLRNEIDSLQEAVTKQKSQYESHKKGKIFDVCSREFCCKSAFIQFI